MVVCGMGSQTQAAQAPIPFPQSRSAYHPHAQEGRVAINSSPLNNCSTSGIVVKAPTATSVQPIARLCSAVSFSESNSAMPAPSICTRAGDETDLRNGDFVLFHVSFDSF